MKRKTRQRLFRGTLYALLVVVVGLALLFVDWEAVTRNFLQLDIAGDLFPEIVTIAARNTLLYTVISFVGGLILGLVLALMKMSSVGPYRWIANVYIEIFRGLPALLTIFFFVFAFPIAFGFRLPGGSIGAGIMGLTVVAAAYMAETIRAGIEAVPTGQREAARSLGMSGGWALVSIVIPQAFRIIIPPLTNEFILLIKDTSLLFIAGTTFTTEELTKFGRDELLNTGNSTPLIVAGLLYLVITIPLTRVVAQLEKRNRLAR